MLNECTLLSSLVIKCEVEWYRERFHKVFRLYNGNVVESEDFFIVTRQNFENKMEE